MKKSILFIMCLSVTAACLPMLSNPSEVSAFLEYVNSDDDLSGVPFVCDAHDIVKIISGEEEKLYFGSVVGGAYHGRILPLPEKTSTYEELAELLRKENNNICYAYFEKEDCIVFCDYTHETVSELDYKMDVKYIIDTNKMEIIDSKTGEVLQNLEENYEFWALEHLNDGRIRKLRILYTDMGFISPASSEVMLLGDIDSDGDIDVSDLSELSLALIGDSKLTVSQKISADVDKDGKVTLSDLARMRQFLSKTIEAF